MPSILHNYGQFLTNEIFSPTENRTLVVVFDDFEISNIQDFQRLAYLLNKNKLICSDGIEITFEVIFGKSSQMQIHI